jgi:hypothetical protein
VLCAVVTALFLPGRTPGPEGGDPKEELVSTVD